MPTKTSTEVMTFKELREKAKAKGIVGYSKMEKRQLFKELPNPNKKQPSEADLKLPRVGAETYWYMSEGEKSDIAPCLVVDYRENSEGTLLEEYLVKKISANLTETHFDTDIVFSPTGKITKKAPAKKSSTKAAPKKKGPSKKDLQAKAKAKKISGFSKMTVDELKEALKKPSAHQKKAPAKAKKAPAKKAPAKETSTKPKGVSKARGASMAKTHAQLVGMAKRRKIEGAKEMTKAQLVAAINAVAPAKKAPAKKAAPSKAKKAPAKKAGPTKAKGKRKGPSKADLQAKAKKKGIKGFSKMNKDQLVAALK
jgi:hypothetical protein